MNVYLFKVSSLAFLAYILLALNILWIYPQTGWAQSTPPMRYTVQPGDSLSIIAERFYNDASRWRELYRANKRRIRNPGILVVGWELIIPNVPERSNLPEQPDVPQADLKRLEAEPLPLPAPASPPVAAIPLPRVSLPPATADLPEGTGKQITLVIGREFPPFTGKTLPQQGMLTDVVRTALESMGYDVEFEFWGRAHGFKAAQEGRFSGTFPHFIKRAHLTHFFYSKPLFQMLIRGFVHARKPFKFDQIEDLSGRVVCRPEGYDLYDLQPLLLKNRITLKAPKAIETCFKMLMQGTVDVVSVHEFTGQEVLHDAGLTEHVCMLDNVISVDTVHLLFPKRILQSEGRMKTFDQTLTRLETAGALEKIYSRHLKPYYDRFDVPPAYCSGDAKSVRR